MPLVCWSKFRSRFGGRQTPGGSNGKTTSKYQRHEGHARDQCSDIPQGCQRGLRYEQGAQTGSQSLASVDGRRVQGDDHVLLVGSDADKRCCCNGRIAKTTTPHATKATPAQITTNAEPSAGKTEKASSETARTRSIGIAFIR